MLVMLSTRQQGIYHEHKSPQSRSNELKCPTQMKQTMHKQRMTGAHNATP